jgi:hypothetical protein
MKSFSANIYTQVLETRVRKKNQITSYISQQTSILIILETRVRKKKSNNKLYLSTNIYAQNTSDEGKKK